MTRQPIYIIIFTLILIGVATFEILYTKNVIDTVRASTSKMEELFNQEEYDSIHIEAIELEKYWMDHEHVLCLIYNHNDIKNIVLEINQIKSYCKILNEEEIIAHINLLNINIELVTHTIQFNLENVI